MFQNLLSPTRKKEFKQEYYTRLITVFALLLSGAFFVGIVALFPSYVGVMSTLDSVETELEVKKKEADNNKEFINETAKSAYVIQTLNDVLELEKLTDVIDEALQKRTEGIAVVGFTYNRKENSLLLEGIAETRDMVAPFAHTLESCERFTSVPVPISDLAEKKDLTFRLNIELHEGKN